MKIEGCFYRIKVGLRDYKVYAIDLRYSKKVRKLKTPPVPKFYEDDDACDNMEKGLRPSDNISPQIQS